MPIRYTKIRRALILDPSAYRPTPENVGIHSVWAGKTLLEHQIHALEQNGIKEALVIVGPGVSVANNSFALQVINVKPGQNSLGALSECMSFLSEDYLCIGGEVLLSPLHLSLLIDHPFPLTVLCRMRALNKMDVQSGAWVLQAGSDHMIHSMEYIHALDVSMYPSSHYETIQYITLPVWKCRAPANIAFWDFFNTLVQYHVESGDGNHPHTNSWQWLFSQWVGERHKVAAVTTSEGILPFYSGEHMQQIWQQLLQAKKKT